MIEFLFGVIEDLWPLLAAAVAGMQWLASRLIKKKRGSQKSDADPEDFTEDAPPDDVDEAVEIAAEAAEQAEETVETAEETVEQESAPRPKKRTPPVKPPEEPPKEPQPAAKTPHPFLTAQNIRQAIVVSEILGKPKSLRRD